MVNFLKFKIIFFIIFLVQIQILFGASSNDSSIENANRQVNNIGDYKLDNYYRYVDLISKGWNLLISWDFYNNPENWDIASATRKSTGGYLQIEDGILQFGYSTLGAIIYNSNNISIIPGYSYLLIARMKANNPYRAFLGFYKSPEKKLHYYSYVKNTDWEIVSCIYSFTTYANLPPIKNLFPAIQVLTKQDNVYIDWVELWAYPEKGN